MRMRIESMLSHGKENGIRREELARLLGTDERSLRRQIQRERKAGALIMADCKNGYFLPSSEADIRRFVKSMSRRAREIEEVSYMAEKTLAQMTGQEMIQGW